MQITHDKCYKAAYIQLKEQTGSLRTVKVAEDVNLDFLPDGTLFGLELLNIKGQLNFKLLKAHPPLEPSQQ
jgi:uncharacterized protein YuzE